MTNDSFQVCIYRVLRQRVSEDFPGLRWVPVQRKTDQGKHSKCLGCGFSADSLPWLFLSHILCRWFPNEPTDQASAQQTGVSRVPDTVPGLPITTAPDLDSTVVLTAGPGVESTGQDRWAAPLPRLPWALRLHPLLIWGPSLPCPLFFGFWGLGPPTLSEGGSSCRPIQFCFLEQKLMRTELFWDVSSSAFFLWVLVAVKVYTKNCKASG